MNVLANDFVCNFGTEREIKAGSATSKRGACGVAVECSRIEVAECDETKRGRLGAVKEEK